jgi:hypothetical protein
VNRQLSCLCVTVLVPCLAQAQGVRLAGATPQAGGLLPPTVSIAVTAPAAINFTLQQGGTATGTGSITITTTYGAVSVLSTLNLYASFASPTAALSANAAASTGTSLQTTIPSSYVYGQVTTGVPTAFTPFTQSGSNGIGTAGASLQLVNMPLVLSLLGGSRTDTLNLQIQLPAALKLAPGSYSGTLTIQAVTF